MLIPVIKVKDVRYGTKPHIVGTDPHDQLFIDEETGGIHYMSLHNSESTERVISGEKYGEYVYEFVGTQPDEYNPFPLVEFLTVEELFETIMRELENSAESTEQMCNLFSEYLNKKKETDKRIADAKQKSNIFIL